MTSHIVALDRDVRAASVVRSRLGGHDLLIWRGISGEVRVWEDRCPHRSVRLSAGRNMGSYFEAVYHGWQFGEDGSVLVVPAEGGKAYPEIRVRVLSSKVAGGFVWAALEGEVLPDPKMAGQPSRPLHVSAPAEELVGRLPVTFHVTPWGADECMIFGLSEDPEETHRSLLRLRRELEARA